MVEQTKLQVAAIQMISGPKVEENLLRAEELVIKAGNENAKLVILPEFFIKITNPDDKSRLEMAEALANGPIQEKLSQIARDNKIYLLAGTLLIKDQNTNKYYNTSIVYAPDGSMLAHYEKIHLFKFDDGTHSYDEEATFSAGNKVVCCDIEGFKLGLSICYDLRFPELYRQMGIVDAIVLPSAFTYVTGEAHWEVLSRARAIENQCYFIAVNQGGEHLSGRKTYGHTMIVDPWGKKISGCELGEHIVYAELDKTKINEVRTKLPALWHRRV